MTPCDQQPRRGPGAPTPAGFTSPFRLQVEVWDLSAWVGVLFFNLLLQQERKKKKPKPKPPTRKC